MKKSFGERNASRIKQLTISKPAPYYIIIYRVSIPIETDNHRLTTLLTSNMYCGLPWTLHYNTVNPSTVQMTPQAKNPNSNTLNIPSTNFITTPC